MTRDRLSPEEHAAGFAVMESSIPAGLTIAEWRVSRRTPRGPRFRRLRSIGRARRGEL
jgi:hypothetical protein